MLRPRSIAHLLPILLLLSAFAASAEEPTRVSIKGYKFIPETLTVKAGTTVEWVNDEKRQFHSVWFKAEGVPAPDYFFPGEKFIRTFDKAGTFPYECGPHPEMKGTVVVE